MVLLRPSIGATLLQTFPDGTKVYQGNVDNEWTAYGTAFGGALLGVTLNASSQFQSDGAHRDPMHLSSQFLRPVSPGPITVRVRALSKGKEGDVLNVGLYQRGSLVLASQLAYRDFSIPFNSTSPTPPEEYKSRCPFTIHPSEAEASTSSDAAYRFSEMYRRTDDNVLLRQNVRITQQGRKEEGLVWGGWVQLASESLGPSAIPIVAGVGETTWRSLSKEAAHPKEWWYLPVTFTVEFKQRLPIDGFAPDTFGLFSIKRHLDGGQESDSFEMWTAPGAIGEPRQAGDQRWRERMVCVAVGTQVTMMASANARGRL